MTRILNGFEVSKAIRQSLKEKVAKIEGRKPGLTVVIVGEDPASQTYVASKAKQAQDVGFVSNVLEFDVDISEETLLEEIEKLIYTINKKYRTTIIWITHDINQARQMGDYVWVMMQGQLIESGSISLLDHPKTDKVAQFLKGRSS